VNACPTVDPAGELLDPADVSATPNADGTATLALPAPDPATRFYQVEAQ
jgi:hypothetical protein